MKYQVVVGNIGTIYDGNNYVTAMSNYSKYVDASKNNYGRAAGENVILMRDNEPMVEYFGDINND